MDLTTDWIEQDINPEQREERKATHKLELLRDLLARRYWSLTVACYVLSGVHPDTPIGSENRELKLQLLPGLDVPKDKYEWLDLESEMIEAEGLFRDRLESVDDIADLSPRDIVNLCVDAEINPPWLEIAKNDPECAKSLAPDVNSDSTLAEEPDSTPERKLSLQELARMGGIARNQKLFGPLDKAVFKLLDEVCHQGIPKTWFAKKNPNKIVVRKAANALINMYELPDNKDGEPYIIETIEKRIRKWIAAQELHEK